MAHSAPLCHQKASRVVLHGLQEPADIVADKLVFVTIKC
jgi:hypothetical protein